MTNDDAVTRGMAAGTRRGGRHASSGEGAGAAVDNPVAADSKGREKEQAARVRHAEREQAAAAQRSGAHAPGLFDPIDLGHERIRNRIWLPPMCMYSVARQDGVPTDFHYQHYVSRALGGFGMVIVESTAVSPKGRISPCDLGLWNDTQAEAFRRIAADVRAAGALPVVQLNHSGRKGSSGCTPLGYIGRTVPEGEGGWRPEAPSPLAYGRMEEPTQLSVEDIRGVVRDFASAAQRAVQAGFGGIEIHAAHGYLLSEFLDPISNQRTDDYGGSLDNRMRLTLEVSEAVRAVIPRGMPLLVRVSATDWAGDGGWDLAQTIELARALKARGVDLIDVSTGQIVHGVHTPAKPNYQVPFSERIRSKALVPTTAVGLITKPKQAQRIVKHEQADAVEIGRAGLRDPYWPLRAAYKLGLPTDRAPYPEQYVRAAFGTKR
ncbi:oxidoreductase [Bifidobacterium xylocopae]|uniref:Oxidoreductase n=2 Tax=Bifidobacterium xylocopae TaxID=2493119 RepID=A0A366KF00_9BIFI|nr:oxidoreductase [Bifidobacterium xylocopae]